MGYPCNHHLAIDLAIQSPVLEHNSKSHLIVLVQIEEKQQSGTVSYYANGKLCQCMRLHAVWREPANKKKQHV